VLTGPRHQLSLGRLADSRVLSVDPSHDRDTSTTTTTMTSTMTLTPTTHDKVNLGRLVPKLQENTPLPNAVDSYQEWLKVQGALQVCVLR
jgi:hypothetical protein